MSTSAPALSTPLKAALGVTLLAALLYGTYTLLRPAEPALEPPARKQKRKKSQNLSPDELKEKGNAHFSQKEYQKAIEYYTTAIEKEENCTYYANRAACWNSLGQFHNVIADCDEALKLSPDYTKCYLRRGTAYEALENLEEAAIDFLSVCVLEGAQGASTKMNMGKAEKCTIAIANVSTETLVQSKEDVKYPVLPPQAYVRQVFLQYRYTYLTDLKLSENPSSCDAALHKAIELLIDERHHESYEIMQSLEEGEDNYSSDLYRATADNIMGTYYMIASDIPRARQSLERSLERHPIVNTYLKLASIKLVIQDSDGSVEMITAAEQLSSNDPDIEFAKATLAADLGDGEVSIRGYERAYDLDNSRPIALLMLAGIYPYFGHPEKSITTIETLAEKFPQDPDVICASAELASRNGDIEGALAAFDRAFATKQRSQYLVAKGSLLLSINRTTEACEMFERCIAFEPGFEQGYEQLYRQLMQAGEIKQSVEVLSREIEAISKWAGIEKVKEMCAVRSLLQCFVTLEERRPDWRERINTLIGSSQQ